MTEPYDVDVGFPIKGLAEITPFAQQEDGTSPDMLNMLPFDETTGRLRGQMRPGLSKLSSVVVSAADEPVQGLFWLYGTLVTESEGSIAPIFSTKGSTGNAAFLGLYDEDGGETSTSFTGTHIGTTFGPDEAVYLVSVVTTTMTIQKYNAPVADVEAAAWSTDTTMTGTMTAADLYGIVASDSVIYVWVKTKATDGECIMRFSTSSGANLDGTDGCWKTMSYTSGNIVIQLTGTTTSENNGMMALRGSTLALWGLSGATEVELCLLNVSTEAATYSAGAGGVSAVKPRRVVYGGNGLIYVAVTYVAGGVTYSLLIEYNGSAVQTAFDDEISVASPLRDIAWDTVKTKLIACGSGPLSSAQKLVEVTPTTLAVVDITYATTFDTMSVGFTSGHYYLHSGTSLKSITSDGSTERWTKTLLTGGRSVSGQAYVPLAAEGGTGVFGDTYNKLIAVSGGDVRLIDATSSTMLTDGESALSSSVNAIYVANLGAYAFFADGSATPKYYEPDGDAVLPWMSMGGNGTVPSEFKYIESWDKRLVVFGFDDAPDEYAFAARNDGFDWQYTSDTPLTAISGSTGSIGRFPGKLSAMIPYNDDLLLMCGDNSIHELTGDPSDGGVLSQVTSEVGVAPGRAWVQDLFGNVFFFGSLGGVYRLSLDTSPVKISSNAVERRLQNIDPSTAQITMQHDEQRQGLWLFIWEPSTNNSFSYFYSYRTEGWFPIEFAEGDYRPVVSSKMTDGSFTGTTEIILGCPDGFIRKLDSTLQLDESSRFPAHAVMGPFIARSGMGDDVLVEHLSSNFSRLSRAKVTVRSGDTPEEAVENPKDMWSTNVSGRENSFPRTGAPSVSVKIERVSGQTQIEGMRLKMRDQRKL